jgi:hypothetical protein
MKGAILFHKPVLGALSGILLVSASLAQTPQPLPPGPPPNPERPALTPYPSDEDFSFLEDPANRTDFWDPLKFIPLGSDPADFLSLGFEYRSEYEWFHNSLWGAGPQTRGGYWLQRIIPQADFRLGPHFRFYLSFQSELERGRNGGPRPMIDEDDFDPHEAFLDISTDTEAKQSLTLRSGRQELVYGAGRLLDDNEGVNVKSSFDGIRLIAKNEWARVDAFAVKPTNLNTGILDDGPSRTQTLWGIYATLPFPILANGQADIYYIGLDTTRASYENNSGREIRETNGVRLFNHEAGTPYEGGFDYNWEFIYQWGSLADNSINAFGIGTETGYTFNTWLKPRVGLIADAISGGNNSHPGTLNTFNPLFPRGSYFAYHMALFGPYNLIHVHPALILNPAQNLVVQFDWGWFWRENTRDGLYAPGGALLRSGLTTRARYIGNQGEVIVLWALDAHTTLSFNVAGFLTGAFLQQTMPGKDIGFMNLGITYRF